MHRTQLRREGLTAVRVIYTLFLLASLAGIGSPSGSAGGGSLFQSMPDDQPAASQPSNLVATGQPDANGPAPQVGARAFAILDPACGGLIAGKNEHQRLPPASLTKIFTALVTAGKADLSSQVEVEVDGAQMARSGSSVMGIEPGMHLSVLDLLYGLFLPSGNDAALALAQFVSGDTAHFADLMNQEAADLGLHDSHFTNPHGLDNPRLYSSAYDLAVAGRALLQDPVLAAISSAPFYTPPSPDWPDKELKNGNKLLQLYPGAYGVKIGYTERADQTIVAAAERNGRRLIVTVLGTADRYGDAITLLDWAFSHTSDGCLAPPEPSA